MDITAKRSIELLEDSFEKKLISFLKEMKKVGDPMNAHETLRTAERQAYLRRTGKSKVKVSNHQSGKAADLHFIKYPNFPKAGDKRWLQAAKIAKKYGIDCGGILWKWDWNHFQDDGQLPLAKVSTNQLPLAPSKRGDDSNNEYIEDPKAVQAVLSVNSYAWKGLSEENRRAVERCSGVLRK